MLTTEQIKSVFNSSPTSSLVMHADAPHFTIVYANEAFLRAANSRLEDITGKRFFEVFPANPAEDKLQNRPDVAGSFDYAILNKEAHKISLYRYDIKSKDSAKFEQRFWNTDVYPILNEQQEVMYLVFNPLDITEKVAIKKEHYSFANKVLHKKKISHPLFNDYPDAVFTVDLEGTFISFNKVLPELAECTPEFLLQSRFVSFIAPEDMDMVLEKFKLSISGEVKNYDTQVITAAGNRRILNITSVPILVKGEIVGIYIIAKDLTAVKEAEIKLLEYNQRISNILESITDGVYSVDNNWMITSWNKEAERIIGIRREEILGKNLWEMFPLAVPLKFYKENHKAMSGKITVRYKEYYAPLSIWLELTAYPTNEGLSIYFQDVTENVKTQRELQEAKEKYQLLFDLNPLPNWVYDNETLKFLDVNKAAIENYGYSREEFLSMTLREIRPAEDVGKFEEMLQERLNESSLYRTTARHLKKSGELIYVDISVNTILFGSKKAGLVVAVDVTERLEAESATKISNERFNIVTKATSDVIYDWNTVNDSLTWNDGIKSIFGYEEDSLHTVDAWLNVIHPDDRDDVSFSINQHIGNRIPRINIEYRFRTADGTYKFVLDRGYLMYDDTGEPVRMIGAIQDITERNDYIREIEAKNQKLSDITWTQCHVVRAPLSRILGLAELLTYDEQDLSKMELLSHLTHSAIQLDNIVKDIIKKTETLK
ncbi:PAS domain-containing protein [Pedobacter immunditicola]|uniref:PAS domain-containing protein n=1 Tax=Pedobacter immunditicola TaxID=3133440 RepID=UPI0030A5E96B